MSATSAVPLERSRKVALSLEPHVADKLGEIALAWGMSTSHAVRLLVLRYQFTPQDTQSIEWVRANRARWESVVQRERTA